MRLWTLHPRYLDPQGLGALWREALLARAAPQAHPLFRIKPGAVEDWERTQPG